MQQRLRRYSPKLAAVFVCTMAGLIAQEASNYVTPAVLRVGEKLACRCGGCHFTVGSCGMLRCEYSDPMRQRIAHMQSQGITDDAIVAAVVKEEGIVALSTPPASGWGLFTWVMPALALIFGFLLYSRWVRRNRQQPIPMTESDRAMIERYRTQIDREFGEDEKEPVK